MIKLLLYLIVVAFLHALWETEIEGKNGWATNLPTWRISNPYKKTFNGKDITGYHIFMIAIWTMFFHGYFLFNSWSLGKEFICIGMMLIYLIIEDFLWFIVNPYYNIKKFFQQKVKWHKKWFLGVPIDYWTFILTGSYLIIIGQLL